MIGVLLLGFTLGLKHALEPDHLAAVATLATGATSLRRALRHGAMWGMGHTLTLLAVGGTVLILGRQIPKMTGDILELIVGLVLLWLGVDVIRRVRRLHLHQHAHDDGTRHLHVHSHAAHETHRPAAHDDHAHPVIRPRRALMVGMVHGMAGSAALVVITAGAIASPITGLVYILLFGLGSVVGMSLVAMGFALPLRLSGRARRGSQWLMLAAAAASLVVGAGIVVTAGASLSRG
jgi:ABC-type nickel/cobalt efflux system permease component RcnA